MNQRNAIPANGTRLRARTINRRFAGSVSHAAPSAAPEGAARRIRTSALANKSENTIPATPAALGVRKLARRAASRHPCPRSGRLGSALAVTVGAEGFEDPDLQHVRGGFRSCAPVRLGMTESVRW